MLLVAVPPGEASEPIMLLLAVPPGEASEPMILLRRLEDCCG
jgi:hypothetical protein